MPEQTFFKTFFSREFIWEIVRILIVGTERGGHQWEGKCIEEYDRYKSVTK